MVIRSLLSNEKKEMEMNKVENDRTCKCGCASEARATSNR